MADEQPDMKLVGSIESIVVGCLMVAAARAAKSEDVLPSRGTTITSGNGLIVCVTRQGRILTSTDGCTWAQQLLPCRTFLRGVTYGNSLFVAVGGSYIDIPGVILTSHDGTNWTRRNRQNKTTLHGVAHGSALFVAVGDAGTILISSNGLDWKPGPSVTSMNLAAISFGNGTFVAGGESGTVLTSTNALHWSDQSLGSSLYFAQLAFQDGVFYLRDSDVTFTSFNGLEWLGPGDVAGFR
jgi:hypothetical protein